jgi:ATP-dependent protease ClpP protease subunit
MFARLNGHSHLRNKSESEAEDETPGVYTRVIGNEVYFYGEVSQESVLELNITLKTLQRDLLIKYAEIGLEESPTIKLYIHSEGGCVFAGLSAMDHIRTMKIPVTTIVDGVCFSAAKLILLGGKKRLMKENSFVLIHQLSNTFWGKFEELKDEMETVTKLMEHIKNLYRKNTTLSETKLKRLMKRDVYLDGDECIRYNIVEGTI